MNLTKMYWKICTYGETLFLTDLSKFDILFWKRNKLSIFRKKYYQFLCFSWLSRAALDSLAGRVFETPALNSRYCLKHLGSLRCSFIFQSLQDKKKVEKALHKRLCLSGNTKYRTGKDHYRWSRQKSRSFLIRRKYFSVLINKLDFHGTNGSPSLPICI